MERIILQSCNLLKRNNLYDKRINLYLCIIKMVRLFGILLIVLWGLILTPRTSYAMRVEPAPMSCTHSTDQQGSTACCEKNLDQQDIADDTCNDTCKSCLCHCPTLNLSPLIPTSYTVVCTPYFAITRNYYDIKIYISSGFHSIWLRPKIG